MLGLPALLGVGGLDGILIVGIFLPLIFGTESSNAVRSNTNKLCSFDDSLSGNSDAGMEEYVFATFAMAPAIDSLFFEDIGIKSTFPFIFFDFELSTVSSSSVRVADLLVEDVYSSSVVSNVSSILLLAFACWLRLWDDRFDFQLITCFCFLGFDANRSELDRSPMYDEAQSIQNLVSDSVMAWL